ncbi:RNA ligase/cyclic nucleotide phosphodiesterase [Xylariaceae sp. FL1019]|nr:RNA ligase/cyclic nucleotide phosphodiesterase [Xylariaceae sp. FL1019]
MATTPNRPAYPPGIPSKFAADGTVVRFPGNTLLCHIPQNSPLQPVLRSIYSAINRHPKLSKVFRLLPPESWHMTVLDGFREEECEGGMWPKGLSKRPLSEMTEILTVSLKKIGLELEKQGLAPPYRVRFVGFDNKPVGLALVIKGATEDEERRLRRLRDVLAEVLGYRAPNHDRYGFHVSVAYLLRHLDEENLDGEMNDLLDKEIKAGRGTEFSLGAVEFCTFEDMFSFPRLFYLGETER